MMLVAQLPTPMQTMVRTIVTPPPSGAGAFDEAFGRMPQATLECFQELRHPATPMHLRAARGSSSSSRAKILLPKMTAAPRQQQAMKAKMG
jgi:hypothetical protein